MPRTYFASYAALRERFLTDAYADRPGEMSLDGDAIFALTGEERDEAMALLREDVAGPYPDPQAVGVLGSFVAREGRPADVAALLACLQSRGRSDARLIAVNALAGVPGPAVDAALLAALDDPGEYVGGRAFDVLAKRLGVDGSVHTRLGRLSARVLSSLRTLREPAVEEIRASFREAAAHPPAPPTDPPPPSAAFERFRCSVFDDPPDGQRKRPPLDVAAFAELAGEERAWGEQWLLDLLADGDPRAYAAVREMQATWAVPALREIASGARGRKAAKALELLEVETTE